jgi:hypothetical protein
MSQLDASTIEAKLQPVLDAFFDRVIGAEASKADLMINFRGGRVVVGDVEHDALVLLQQAGGDLVKMEAEEENQYLLITNRSYESLGAPQVSQIRICEHLGYPCY